MGEKTALSLPQAWVFSLKQFPCSQVTLYTDFVIYVAKELSGCEGGTTDAWFDQKYVIQPGFTALFSISNHQMMILGDQIV
jgi:hypothetical protein